MYIHRDMECLPLDKDDGIFGSRRCRDVICWCEKD
jgi:hypothetical protein